LKIRSRLFTSMTLLRRCILARSRQVPFKLFVDISDDRRVQRFLVPLQCQDVVAFALDDLRRDRLLSTHRINRDDRPFDVHQPQKLRNRRDFVRFLRTRHLTQRQAKFAGPDAHRMQRAQPVVAIVAPPRRLAVHGQDRLFHPRSSGRSRPQRLQPIHKAGLEDARLQRHQHAAKDVLAWNPVGQVQHVQQELFLHGRPSGDRRRSIGSGQHRHQSDDDDTDERMELIDIGAWVLQLREIHDDFVQRDARNIRHGWFSVRRLKGSDGEGCTKRWPKAQALHFTKITQSAR